MGDEGKVYRQERPSWCPHSDCEFKRRAGDSVCGGRLPSVAKETDEHGQYHENDLRLCLNETHLAAPAKVVDLKVNKSDLDWMAWIFDGLDGGKRSWLSRRGEEKK